MLNSARHFFRFALSIAAVAVTIAVAWRSTALAQETPPVMPADARALLAVLSPGDADWKLTESRARSDYNSEWVQVIATRVWEGQPIPAAASGGPALVPKTAVTLTDTGGFPAFNSMFLVTGNPDRTTIGTFPAIKDSSPPAGRENLFVWVAGRFILRIETEHQPRGAAEAWLGRIKTAELQALAAKAGTRVARLPNPVPMFRVDELNPRLNRAWSLAWTDEETIRRANITDR